MRSFGEIEHFHPELVSDQRMMLEDAERKGMERKGMRFSYFAIVDFMSKGGNRMPIGENLL